MYNKVRIVIHVEIFITFLVVDFSPESTEKKECYLIIMSGWNVNLSANFRKNMSKALIITWDDFAAIVNLTWSGMKHALEIMWKHTHTHTMIDICTVSHYATLHLASSIHSISDEWSISFKHAWTCHRWYIRCDDDSAASAPWLRKRLQWSHVSRWSVCHKINIFEISPPMRYFRSSSSIRMPLCCAVDHFINRRVSAAG